MERSVKFQDVRRVSIEQFQNEFNRIVDEVAATGEPVIIQEQGKDLVAVVSVGDFQKILLAKEASLAKDE